jgi:DNA polymerase-3 subunit gamma/tau
MLLSQQAHLKRLDGHRAVVQVASNWITMVQSRLPLLEKAMEATLGSARTITLEPSDQERPAPAPPPALVRSPEPSPVQEPEEPAAAETERPQALDPLEEPPTGPLSAEPPETASGETYIPPAQSQGVQQQPQRQTTDERLLEESTGLLADFFNGQVIQHADSLILQEKEPHRPQDPKPGKG